MKKHFVTFFSPGAFVSEDTTLPIESWDVEQAKIMALSVRERHAARPYAFQFSTRSRGEDDLDSSVSARSPMYYLGGTIKTIDDIRREEPGSILLSNMVCNGWDRVIDNRNSWRVAQPLKPYDIVLEWKP